MDKRQIVNPHANFFQRTFSRIDVAHDFIFKLSSQKHC